MPSCSGVGSGAVVWASFVFSIDVLALPRICAGGTSVYSCYGHVSDSISTSGRITMVIASHVEQLKLLEAA